MISGCAVERGNARVRALHLPERLEEKRFVASEMSESLPQRGGRPRRHFELTKNAEDALR